MTVLPDQRLKESEKRNQYVDFTREQKKKKVRNIKVTVISIVIGKDHSVLLRLARTKRRVLETSRTYGHWYFSKTHLLTLVLKTLLKKTTTTNNNNNNDRPDDLTL